ncbi:MAG: J domain-containing protein [Candidatus Edwardsbacteria bacterium]|nr:J domain-containing protein [Candidatus Edwardsbacteria bacterium]
MNTVGSIQLTLYEKQILLHCFDVLAIPPTLNRNNILWAFREKAKILHPDSTTDPKQKEILHNEFINLIDARDICLEASMIYNLLQQLSSPGQSSVREAPAQTIHTEETHKQRHEEEWAQFVNDKNAYFKIIDASYNFVSSFLSLIGFSIAFSFSLSIGIIFAGIVIGICSTAVVGLPVIGWIIGILIFGGAIGKIIEVYEKTKSYILKTLPSTGYPLSAFVYGWIGITIFILIVAGFNNYLLLLLIPVSIGHSILWFGVSNDLRRIEEGLDKIRSAISTELIVVGASQRFGHR